MWYVFEALWNRLPHQIPSLNHILLCGFSPGGLAVSGPLCWSPLYPHVVDEEVEWLSLRVVADRDLSHRRHVEADPRLVDQPSVNAHLEHGAAARRAGPPP